MSLFTDTSQSKLIEALVSDLKPVSILRPTFQELLFLLGLFVIAAMPISFALGFHSPVWTHSLDLRWWMMTVLFAVGGLYCSFTGLQFRYPENEKKPSLFSEFLILSVIACVWSFFSESADVEFSQISGPWGWRCSLGIIAQVLIAVFLIQSRPRSFYGYQPAKTQLHQLTGIAFLAAALAQFTCRCILPGHLGIAHLLPALLTIGPIYFILNNSGYSDIP